MTAREVPVSDCPEPCACYAAGRGRAYFEVIASFKGPPHAEGCACEPCQVKRACIQPGLSMASSWHGRRNLLRRWSTCDALAMSGRRPAASRPTPGALTSPTGGTAQIGAWSTGALACWQLRLTSAVTCGPAVAAAGQGHAKAPG